MSAEKGAKVQTPIYKKWWFWVIIVVIIGGICAASGSNNEPEKVGEGGSSSDASSGQDENKTFKVGDIVKAGDYEVTVKSVERNYTSSNQFVRPSDGKEFIRANVEIKNISQDKKSYNILDWQVEDADGALESVSLTGTSLDDGNLNSGELTAGGKKSGMLVFEIPKDQTGLKLHYKPTFSFGAKEVIFEI